MRAIIIMSQTNFAVDSCRRRNSFVSSLSSCTVIWMERWRVEGGGTNAIEYQAFKEGGHWAQWAVNIQRNLPLVAWGYVSISQVSRQSQDGGGINSSCLGNSKLPAGISGRNFSAGHTFSPALARVSLSFAFSPSPSPPCPFWTWGYSALASLSALSASDGDSGGLMRLLPSSKAPVTLRSPCMFGKTLEGMIGAGTTNEEVQTSVGQRVLVVCTWRSLVCIFGSLRQPSRSNV